MFLDRIAAVDTLALTFEIGDIDDTVDTVNAGGIEFNFGARASECRAVKSYSGQLARLLV
jgi:hypothetical protein